MIYSHLDYKRNPFLATEDLGSLLHNGSLVLFLGAGASSGFGLPDWPNLVARLLDKGDDSSFIQDLGGKSDNELAKLVDDVDDGTRAYVKKVHRALYAGVNEELSTNLLRSPLLLAVAGLVTGSCRGRITCVFTYNYDDLLKQYLAMLGYSVCIRKEYCTLTRWADVEINYVHGYLPQSKKGLSKPRELVLSAKSYLKRRAEIDAGWSSYVEHGLLSKTGLFMGLSGDDTTNIANLKRAQEKIKRPTDYNGYWLMTPRSFERNQAHILDVGMCPIMLNKEDFPRFVLTVCQKAS